MNDLFLLSASAVAVAAGVTGFALRRWDKFPDPLVSDCVTLVTALAAYFLPEIGVEYALGAVGAGIARRIGKGTSEIPKKPVGKLPG